MSLTIRTGEPQTAFVERVLHEQGRISTFDALYGLSDDKGDRRSITRLAAVIHTLRHDRGWVIDENAAPGELATYRVVRAPNLGRPVGRVRVCPGCGAEHAVGTSCGTLPTHQKEQAA